MEKALTAFIAILLLVSCHTGNTPSTQDEADTIPLHYARNLTLVQHKGWTEAILRNPWDTTQVLHRYALVESEDGKSVELPTSLTRVNVPLHRAAIFTAVHCALVNELGAKESVGGVCEPEYIHLAWVHQGLKEGNIIDLGSGMDPSIEHVMELQPDALMPSPFQNSNGYGRIEQLGIPIIECADYMEVSPLARAEWMRFYGRLFGKTQQADSLFGEVEKQYLSLKKKSDNVEHRPTALIDRPYQGTWYCPGGQSTMGILYRDAGANYIFRDRNESGSLPLSFEAVLEAGSQADYWLLRYNQPTDMTRDELKQDNSLYQHFRAFETNQIYGCNTGLVPFYEETPFHPELLLADLMHIFHPELGTTAEKSYFCPIR